VQEPRREPQGPVRETGALVADSVYESIRRAILAGELPPGHRLRQNDVAGEFQVSHTPVREALARLASEGLVTLRPRRGAEVNSIDPSDVAEIYAIRQLLEPAALEMALARGTDIDRDLIREAAEPPEGEITPLELFDRNRRFHRLLGAGCGNNRLVAILDSLWDSVTAARMFEAYASNDEDIARSNAEHLAIATAIAEHRDADAVTLLTEHLSAARADLLELIAAMEDADG
jgi:DNA-binding GntR family transcriptional regulator